MSRVGPALYQNRLQKLGLDKAASGKEVPNNKKTPPEDVDDIRDIEEEKETVPVPQPLANKNLQYSTISVHQQRRMSMTTNL